MRTLAFVGLMALGIWAIPNSSATRAARTHLANRAADVPLAPGSGPAYAVPAYHLKLPPGGVNALPPTLNPRQFSDPRVSAVYAMAAKIRGVLFRVPCYCRCDRELGHTSLLDCYVSDHASICETCLMEGYFAYQMATKGQSVAQIRGEIERGNWKKVNLNALVSSSSGK